MGIEIFSEAGLAGLIAFSSILAGALAWLREALFAVRVERRR
jgi:hypothetical protein